MLRYQLFPRSTGLTKEIYEVIECFEKVYEQIDASKNTLVSDEVLKILKPHLEKLSYNVEKGKARNQKIPVPVLYGQNNRIDKHFDADALSTNGKIVIEVEAGRAYRNNQFLKDIFQACMMFGVEYLIIAVRNEYKGTDDFMKIYTFLETLYISSRLTLPLKGIVLIGY
ncbi:MAG: hypothetical protein AB8G11_18980 [Saprospiraceae bacterium]